MNPTSLAARYVTRHIINSVLFTALVIFAVFQVANVSEHIRRFNADVPGAVLRAVADSMYLSMSSLLDLAPVCVLIGAMIALNRLQRSRQLQIFKISGNSVWEILVGPIFAVVLLGLTISFVVDPALIKLDNFGQGRINSSATSFLSNDRDVWISQSSTEGSSYIHARSVYAGGAGLRDVTVFVISPTSGLTGRIRAESAELNDGVWTLRNGTIFESDQPASKFGSYIVLSDLTQEGIVLSVGEAKSLPIWSLIWRFREVETDTPAVAAAHMRYHRLIALPLALVGGLLIAFAFSSRYQRVGASGSGMFYGIMLGFLIFVMTKMAEDAGTSGVLDPRIAAWGPPLVAIVASATMLLYVEDG